MTRVKKEVLIKNAKEISVMKELALVHKEVFEEIKKMVKPGTSAMEVNKLCEDICNKYNVLCGFKGVYNFPGNICISINDCVVHGIPTKNMIFQEGDVVKFDFGVKDKRHGLNTDRAFSMIIGDPLKDLEKVKFLKVVEEAMYKGIAKAIAGNRVGDIGHAIQTHVESHGYHIIKDLTGHSIGYNLHEKPYIPNFGQAGKGEILKENMTLAIEPIVGLTTGKIIDKGGFPLYMADGNIGAQFEHTILVKPVYPEIII
ncbi:type I methionyl aminopeptidase [Candidatus Gracilibacteria bacterium]|nr:type I methionyl aminopeptidase [Candidatus Gracilibacteria bacterium]